jgi:tubulin polyglutamylase TTLL7
MKTLIALQPFAQRRQEVLFGCDFSTVKGDCFQVLGFDIFIDRGLKPWIIEVNDHPSLNIMGCYESEEGRI